MHWSLFVDVQAFVEYSMHLKDIYIILQWFAAHENVLCKQMRVFSYFLVLKMIKHVLKWFESLYKCLFKYIRSWVYLCLLKLNSYLLWISWSSRIFIYATVLLKFFVFNQLIFLVELKVVPPFKDTIGFQAT